MSSQLSHQQRLIVRRITAGLAKEFPFFGHLLACCQISKTDELPTAGLLIDESLTIKLGDRYFRSDISYNDQRFILLHEICHFIFKHPLRAGKPDDLKNIAMDIAVNSFLKNHSPFTLPDEALTPAMFNFEWDRSYEYYYTKLLKMQQKCKQCGGQGCGKCSGKGDKKGNGKGRPHAGGEQHSWEVKVSHAEATEFTHRMYQVAKAAGSDPGGSLSELYRVAVHVDWRDEFLRTAQQSELSEEWMFTRRRLSKRYGTIPGLVHDYLGELYLIVDTSGSMGKRELGASFDVVDKLRNIGYLIRIFEVDAKLQQEYIYAGIPPNVKGGGGTMFQSAFEHIAKEYPECEQVIALTDGYVGDLNAKQPPFEVTFVITPDGTKDLPWGNIIQMKLED